MSYSVTRHRNRAAARGGRIGPVIALIAMTAAGCGTPTGGARPSGPAAPSPPPASTLTFAYTGGFAELQIADFHVQLAERSNGEVQLRTSPDFDTDTFGIEGLIIDAVAAGELDLGWVGARAFAELGVHGFDALVAPMLLDSLDAQRAVLASDIPSRMLDEVDGLGVAGLAVIGGPLRRPIAADAPLTSVADFNGIAFHSWHGDVNAASVRALGATNVDSAPSQRNAGIVDGSIRAYENTLSYLSDYVHYRARIMTVNLNLWPSIGVLIANPARLAALPEAQLEALWQSAAAVSAESLDGLQDEAQLAVAVCAGGGALAVVTEPELEAFRAAFAPVYADLRADTATAGYLDEITALTAGIPAEQVPVPAGCGAG